MKILNETISVFTISIVLVTVLSIQSCKTNDSGKFKVRAIFQRKFYLLFIMLQFVGFVSAQSPKKGIDVSKEYRNELKDRLCPKVDTSTTKVVLLFIAQPAFIGPECSFRLIDRADQSFLEVRILEKNLWAEQFKQNKQADSLCVKTSFFSTLVSRSFRDKMVAAFTKVIELHESRIKPNEIQLYDGICYEFMINNNENILFAKINYNLKYDDFRDRVAATNLRIIDTMKRHSFNSSVYEIYR
jgi:hypothetical protein